MSNDINHHYKLMYEQLQRYGLGIEEFHRNVCNQLVEDAPRPPSTNVINFYKEINTIDQVVSLTTTRRKSIIALFWQRVPFKGDDIHNERLEILNDSIGTTVFTSHGFGTLTHVGKASNPLTFNVDYEKTMMTVTLADGQIGRFDVNSILPLIHNEVGD